MSRRIAVLIASSVFPDEPQLADLVAPERDVNGIHEVLAAEKGGVFDEVALLINQPSQKVRLAINRALRKATRDDQLLLYYSGHGKLDPTGKLCLAMCDTVLDALEASSIRIGEIKDFLDASKCKQVMLFLDCCYSGAVGKDFVARSAVDDQLQIAAESAGICIMSASNAVQIALESAEQGLGVFTRHVIEGIKSGAADQNGDGLVTFDELYDYVQKRVIADGHQRPQRWAFQAEGSLVLARSGNWDELRKQLRGKVLELAASQDLPDAVIAQALALLGVNKSAHTREQKLQLALLKELAEGKTKLSAFSFAWASSTASAPTPVPEPEEQVPSAEEDAPPQAATETLNTWPKKIEFGRQVRGAEANQLLKVWHDGRENPKWEFESYGNFFELDRSEEGLTVTLVDDVPGTKQGLIKIRSARGHAEVVVSARIVEAPKSQVQQPVQQHQQAPMMPTPRFTPGRWLIELSAFGIPGAKYTLDIYPNGALAGEVRVFGIAGQIQGTWGYDLSRDIVGMQLAVSTFGMQSGETLQIQITEGSGASLKGKDPMFRTFSFTKLAG
jgi:hypothetical protein